MWPQLYHVQRTAVHSSPPYPLLPKNGGSSYRWYLCFEQKAKSCWLVFFSLPLPETLQAEEEDAMTKAGEQGD